MASLDKRGQGYYRIRWYENCELKSKTFRAESYKDYLFQSLDAEPGTYGDLPTSALTSFCNVSVLIPDRSLLRKKI